MPNPTPREEYTCKDCKSVMDKIQMRTRTGIQLICRNCPNIEPLPHKEIEEKIEPSIPGFDEEKLRKEFQDFADSIVWSNDAGDEKYIGVGNMADWWIQKLSSHHRAVIEQVTRELLKHSARIPKGALSSLLSALKEME